MAKNPLLDSPFSTAETLRMASERWAASPYIHGVPAPSVPTRMLSNESIYEGYTCPSVHKFAKTITPQDSKQTLREFQEKLLSFGPSKRIEYPYVWWVLWGKPKIRAIHEDAAGLLFVKIATLWQLAYPLHIIRGLAGAQSSPDRDYENVPSNGYFVVWDNEEIARKHAG